VAQGECVAVKGEGLASRLPERRRIDDDRVGVELPGPPLYSAPPSRVRERAKRPLGSGKKFTLAVFAASTINPPCEGDQAARALASDSVTPGDRATRW
jgi:hypothetical protein